MRLRIDELAARTGVTSRNIRAYQARDLLPPPTVEGRTGYYGEEHVQRLELIDELQDRGFSLAAIKQTLEAWSQGGDLSHLIGFHNVLMAPWSEEDSEVATAEELFERFPEARDDPELVERAVEQELIVPLEDDTRFEVPSPLLLQAGEALAEAGVPLHDILTMVESVRADMADVAQRFVDLVGEHVVLPVAQGEATDGEVEEVLETTRRLRPIALEVVRPFLAQELERSIERAIRELDLPTESV